MPISEGQPISWSFLHLELQKLLKEELAILREVLSMMREEELCLSEKDLQEKNTLSSKRLALSKTLKDIQKRRSQKTKDLFKIFNKSFNKLSFNSELFDELIAQDEDNSSETLSLRDQILSIMKHIDNLKDQHPFFKSSQSSKAFESKRLDPSSTSSRHQKLKTIESLEDSSQEELD